MSLHGPPGPAHGRPARPRAVVRRQRLRPRRALHPRHPGLAAPVVPPRRPDRRRPPGRRAGPVRPRRVGQADGRLLAQLARRHPARPARPPRHRAGHPGRALARRRHRDAVLLPLPRPGGPPRPRLQRRPRPRGQPGPALGHPPRRRAGAERHRLRARPRSGSRRWVAARRRSAGSRAPTSARSGAASPRWATARAAARSSPPRARSSTSAGRASTPTTTSER